MNWLYNAFYGDMATEQLPSVFQQQFDIVFNIGNSIVHSPNAVTRENLVQVLKKKATLVIETRNQEKIVAKNNRFTVYDKISYFNKEYIPMYHQKLNGIEQEAEVEILFQEIWEDNHVELYENSLSFTPFTDMSLLDTIQYKYNRQLFMIIKFKNIYFQK